MKIDISEYEKRYTFELDSVTQLCGQNMVKKTYILESMRRYFSTFKYPEQPNKWRDNVKVDNKVVGRKFFTLISVKGISDILAMLGWAKQSLFTQYMKQLIEKLDCQMHLRTITDEVEEIIGLMNKEMNQLGNIELTYTISDVWDMVQNSSITGCDETLLENQGNYELLLIFLNLLEEIVKVNPKKILVILENIDHLISRKEYRDVLSKLQNIGMKYDIYFILSTSIDGYIGCEPSLCNGISVFGDVDFQMPEFDKILEYIQDNYPYNKKIDKKQLENDLEGIIHKIGQKQFLCSVEESVICKLINQSMMIYEKWNETENTAEIAFLKT